jgi:hypothetical protein
MLSNTSDPSLTPALAHIRERQRKHPPRYPRGMDGLDRAQALSRLLHSQLGAEMQGLLDSGVIAVGEIGRFEPTIETLPLRDRNFAVEVATGLMDFHYAVGRALAGLIVRYSGPETPLNTPPLELKEAADLVVKVYREWQHYADRGWPLFPFKRRKRIRHADFVLAEVAREPTEALVTAAELFMISHEFGHVMLDRGLRKPDSENDELSADSLGFELYMQPAARIFGTRLAYAGAVFAIRVTAGLERMGVKFSHRYPPPAARTDNLRDRFAQSCPSPQWFDEASTIAVAYQDMMDDVDRGFAPGAAPTALDADRLRIRILAELQELAMSRHTRQRFVANIETIAEAQHHESLRQAFAELNRYYLTSPPRESYLPLQMRADMAAELLACGMMMSPELRALAATEPSLAFMKAYIAAARSNEET